MKPWVVSTLSTVFLGASAIFAGWAVLAYGSPTRGEGEQDPPALASPTPVRLVPLEAVADAQRVLATAHPEAARVVDWLLAADAQSVVDSMPRAAYPCEGIYLRGADGCAAYGVAHGTVVELVYPILSLPGFGMQPSDAVAMLSHYLSGRSPRLGLLAAQDDDDYLLVIIIDEVEERVFPSGEPAGGPPIGSVEVVLSADGAVVGIDARPSGSPPLETLRYNERNGVVRYSILGSSEEFRAIEEAWHQELEDRRRDPLTGVNQGSD